MPGTRVQPLDHPRRFLDLQRAFYRGDPHYVPPMTATEAWTVDRRRNPFFAHGRASFWAAWRDGRPVGRISAAVDDLHDGFHGDRVGFFGHFEAADEEAAHALLGRAREWLAEHGRKAMRGPIELSTNYRCGLLVDGDPGPPALMMPHNPPEYAAWIGSWGLRPARDLLALELIEERFDRRRLERVLDRLRARSGAVLRPLDMRAFEREVATVWALYNRIWERNWGFVPMSEAEFRRQARDLKAIAEPRLLQIAEVGGEPVGFIVALPDVNPAVRACDGRLLPLGWWRFLRARRRIDRLRVITLGLLPEHRNSGLETLLMHAVTDNGLELGYRACEASWILEDNHRMIRPLEQMGARVHRRYRIYETPLTPASP